MVVGTCHLQGRQSLLWGRFSVSSEQIGQPSFFSQQLLMWFGTFTLGSTASRGFQVWTCSLQGMLPSQWGRSPVSFEDIGKPSFFSRWLLIYLGQCCFKGVLGMDLLSSGDVAPNMGQVPCEFWADQPNFIFQSAASDVIWHIYSHLCCSSRDSGRDLPSSRQEALTMGKVPCEFWADRSGFSFLGEELRQGSFQCGVWTKFSLKFP